MNNKRLDTISEVMEIILNFCVVLCLELAVQGASGRREELGWHYFYMFFLAAALYACRKYCRKFLLFLLLHAGIFVLYLWPVREDIVWLCTAALLAVIYEGHSLKVRIKSRWSAEGVFYIPFAGASAAGAFVLCGHFDWKYGQDRILWIVIFYIFLLFLYQYLENYLGFLDVNRRSSGKIPEKNMFQNGAVLMVFFSLGTGLLIFLAAGSGLFDVLTEGMKSLLWGIARIIGKLLAQDTEEVPQEITGQPAAEGAAPVMPGEYSPPPEWLVLLQNLLMYLVQAALVIAAVYLLFRLIRWLIHEFYKEKPGEEKEEALFEEWAEKITRDRKKDRKLFRRFTGNSQEKVRYIYEKSVASAAEKLEFEKQKLSPLTVEEIEETMREAAIFREESEKKDWKRGWRGLSALYEQARYGKEAVDKEKVREALLYQGLLRRQLRKLSVDRKKETKDQDTDFKTKGPSGNFLVKSAYHKRKKAAKKDNN